MSAPPRRTSTRVAGLLAMLACVGCCALPYLMVGGLITRAGTAVMQQTFIAAAIGMSVLALGKWWLRRRQLAKPAAAGGKAPWSSGTSPPSVPG